MTLMLNNDNGRSFIDINVCTSNVYGLKLLTFNGVIYTLHFSLTHTYNSQMSTITRSWFVKFSLDGCCGEKMECTRGIRQRKPSTGSHRTDSTISTITRNGKPSDVSRRNDPTMSTITRNGFVKFCLDGRCGKKVKFVKAWVVSQTHVSARSRKVKTGKPRKKTYVNRLCACGDMYCNHISKFLGSMITEKCSYQNPEQYNKDANKQLRCEKIRNHLVTCRKKRNDLFTTPVPTDPPKHGRFNEIHYSILFLMRAVKRSKRRIPESMDVGVAKETNMFREDLVRYYKHYRKERVVVVPTLNAHQAVQVYIMF